jgi:translation initiation factor 3 subunit M
MYFAKICSHLSQPMTGASTHGPGLALTLLSTMFNVIPPADDSRYHVLLAIIKVVKSSGSYESLKPQMGNIEQWLASWEIEEDDQRKLYLAVADVARDVGEDEEAYKYTLKALRTIPAAESGGSEARSLALVALKAALQSPTHFDFQDITGLDAVQALRNSDPKYFELLELFTSEQLDDLNDFKDEHEGWIEGEGLDKEALDRKMRLLTLASLAASAGQSRQLPYGHIARALQITEEDVEMWVIDVIRAGLVEGKLSQQTKTFLIHRSTYRVFGENQWREVAARLDMWKSSLTGVLKIVRLEKENFKAAREQERREAETKAAGAEGREGRGGFRRGPQRERAPAAVENEAD